MRALEEYRGWTRLMDAETGSVDYHLALRHRANLIGHLSDLVTFLRST